jgi:hypothetical protein
MADFPSSDNNVGATLYINPAHRWSLGTAIRSLHHSTGFASGAWPTANKAVFVPFRLPRQYTAYKMMVGQGATAAGNFCCGIYDEWGNRLVTSGATAKAASAEAVIDITDTEIGPGLYFMALSADGTNNYMQFSAANAGCNKAVGMREMTTAYVLPNPATFATITSVQVPQMGVYLRSK